MKFRRQHPIGWFVADFWCPECRLIVEIDGSVHDETVEDDANRTRTLEEAGYTVIRCRNEEVFNDLASVLERILAAAQSSNSVDHTH